MAKEDRAQYRTHVPEHLPDHLDLGNGFDKTMSLRYGHNPGGPAASYMERGATGPTMASLKVLQAGKGLGFINIDDMDLGQSLVRDLHALYPDRVSYCIVKHAIPSGVALGADTDEAFARAWGCDPLSSFGGVHVTSREVNGHLARLLVEPARNVEVIYAPSFTRDALEVLRTRDTLRVVEMSPLDEAALDNGLNYRRVTGGMLVESRVPSRILSSLDFDCVSRRVPTLQQEGAGLFMWQVCRWTHSNAIVIGDHEKTHGIGAGQQSRIDAAHMAVYKSEGRESRNHGYGSRDTVMASDAFLPHTDVVELAARRGIRGIVAPLGSIKDDDVLKAANDHDLFFLVTRRQGEHDSERAFLHR